MAKRRKRDSQWNDSSQRGFHDSDFQWLAEQFQKQSAQNPNLTLKEFAIRYGVQPECIRRFINVSSDTADQLTMSVKRAARHFGVGMRLVRQWVSSGALKADRINGEWHIQLNVPETPDAENEKIVTLWHGTTADCAEAIREQGFKTRSRQLWFTTKASFARRHANGRALMRGKIPVVFRCEIDLTRYTKFWRPGPHIYVFLHPLPKGIIREVEAIEGSKFSRRSAKKDNDQKSIDVTITRTSSKLGVWWWLNHYLELAGEDALSKDHSAVESIDQWIKAQYAAGREEAISDEEMLAQVKLHFKAVHLDFE